MKVAVIGAGISGLAAALELHDRVPDWQLTVYESDQVPGGLLQTEQRGQFCYELGPDSLLCRLPWGIDLCRRVGLSEQLISTGPQARGIYTVYRGSLVRMPASLTLAGPKKIWPVMKTPILSLPGKLRMACERFIPRREQAEDESLDQFALRRFGRDAFERILQPMAGGIYMGDPKQLSMQAAFPQLVAAEQECGSLIKWCRQTTKSKKTKQPEPSMFVAPQNGFGQLISAIVDQLPDNVLQLRTRIEKLTRTSDDRWTVQGTRQATKQAFSETFDQLILATPAQQSARLFDSIDPLLSQQIGTIEHGSCVIINLTFPNHAIGIPLNASGIIVPLIEQRKISACTFSSTKYLGRIPQGIAMLRLFLGGVGQPEAIDLTDEQLLAMANHELRSLLQVNEKPIFHRISRWREKMPQYHVGHLDRVNKIETLVSQLPNLELIGNAYRGVGIPHCIHYAQQAVQRLVAQSTKI